MMRPLEPAVRREVPPTHALPVRRDPGFGRTNKTYFRDRLNAFYTTQKRGKDVHSTAEMLAPLYLRPILCFA